MANRSALGMIGLMLGAATVFVTVTAAVVVSGYRADEMTTAANVPLATGIPAVIH